MSWVMVLGVAGLGGLGAVARAVLDGWISGRPRSGFPRGILLVNLLGAFLLGVLIGADAGAGALRLLGTGLIGAFTTFSTWIYDSDRLARAGRRRAFVANLLLSLALGLATVWLGRLIGRSL